jgi:hypothetical protein
MIYRRALGATLASLLALALCGCGVPVPEDKLDYVGQWEGDGMWLEITSDGHVEYELQRGSVRKSVSGPLKGFEGPGFVVGVWFIKTTFEVQRPPYREDEAWMMVVDGVKLTRMR